MCSANEVAVIGCGIFGSMVAMRLAENGFNVTIYERNNECLAGASFNNQNRLHLGFHYPRDLKTAKQCIKGFDRFLNKFPECIVSNFPNAYFVSEKDSLTSEDAYIDFCNSLNIYSKPIRNTDVPIEVKNVAKGILCNEVVYDSNILRSSILEKINISSICLETKSTIKKIKKIGTKYILNENDKKPFDVVVNCSYSDINRLTEQLGYEIDSVQYEYTFIPIVKLNRERIGVTIMDGPFMTLLPFGKTNNFLLYHVEHSVIARENAKKMNLSWLDSDKSPLSKIDLKKHFEQMKKSCEYFIPELSNAKMVGVLQGPRMVKSKSEKNDERPSIVNSYGNYFTVFSGKIDHSMWVADDVLNLIK